MVAMIEKNPRQGVELRERGPEKLEELIAATACYVLVGAAGYALITGNAKPLLLAVAAVFVALYLARPRR